MSVTMNLGRVKPLWRGVYDSNTAYKALDIIRWQGSVYLCTQDAQGITPSNADYFQSISGDKTVITWASISGAAQPPLMVYHNADYWLLIMPTENVELNEPGGSLAWQRIPDDNTFIERPSITSPADGATGFTGTITSSAYRTGERFTGEHTKSIFQSSTDSDFVSIYAEQVIDEGTLTEWTSMPLASPNTDVWIRVRYESNGFSSEWSPIIKVTLPNYQAGPPVFISPVEGETGWLPGSELEITAYLPNLDDEHAMTSWQVESDQGQLVWQSLEDAQNLTTITTPDSIFSPAAGYRARAKFFGVQFVDQEWGDWRTFTTRAHPTATAQAPTDNATNVSPTTTLELQSFPAGLTHTTTEWRILSESSPGVFDTVVYQFGPTSVDKLAHQIPEGTLSADTAYQWQARFATSEYGTAPWSTAFTLTTMPKPVPVLSYPLNAEADVMPATTFEISDIPTGLNHQATTWRIWEEGNPVSAPGVFDTLAYEHQSTAGDLTKHTLPIEELEQDRQYQWEAMVATGDYGNGSWSSRSTFTTRDLFPPRKILSYTSIDLQSLGYTETHETGAYSVLIHDNMLYFDARTPEFSPTTGVISFDLLTNGYSFSTALYPSSLTTEAVDGNYYYIAYKDSDSARAFSLPGFTETGFYAERAHDGIVADGAYVYLMNNPYIRKLDAGTLASVNYASGDFSGALNMENQGKLLYVYSEDLLTIDKQTLTSTLQVSNAGWSELNYSNDEIAIRPRLLSGAAPIRIYDADTFQLIRDGINAPEQVVFMDKYYLHSLYLLNGDYYLEITDHITGQVVSEMNLWDDSLSRARYVGGDQNCALVVEDAPYNRVINIGR